MERPPLLLLLISYILNITSKKDAIALIICYLVIGEFIIARGSQADTVVVVQASDSGYRGPPFAKTERHGHTFKLFG